MEFMQKKEDLTSLAEADNVILSYPLTLTTKERTMKTLLTVCLLFVCSTANAQWGTPLNRSLYSPVAVNPFVIEPPRKATTHIKIVMPKGERVRTKRMDWVDTVVTNRKGEVIKTREDWLPVVNGRYPIFNMVPSNNWNRAYICEYPIYNKAIETEDEQAAREQRSIKTAKSCDRINGLDF